MYAHGRDLSEGGLGLYVPTELSLGDIALLEITVPYCQEKMLLKCVVRNREGFRYGLEFLQLSEHEQSLIRNSCRALCLLQ